MTSKKNGKTPPGFSLVEVVMALGIFSFSIVGVLGLFPIALQTQSDAKAGTIQAQIKQQLAAEVLLTDFTKLSSLNGEMHYFDENGVEVISTDAASMLRPKIYTSEIVVTTAALPSGSGTYAPSSMAKVIIYSIHDPAQRGISTSNTSPVGAILIANTSPSS